MRNKRILIKDPEGNLFNVADAHGVDQVSTGVLILGANRRIIHFIKVADEVQAMLYRDEIVKAVEEALAGRKYQPKWETSTPA
jgi:hypothetical protein